MQGDLARQKPWICPFHLPFQEFYFAGPCVTLLLAATVLLSMPLSDRVSNIRTHHSTMTSILGQNARGICMHNYAKRFQHSGPYLLYWQFAVKTVTRVSSSSRHECCRLEVSCLPHRLLAAISKISCTCRKFIRARPQAILMYMHHQACIHT